MAKKNPWLNIWIHPRDTIRRVVAENPNKGLWILAIIYGFSYLLGMFQSLSIGNHLGVISIFLLALVLSPICGYIVFSFAGWLTYWTGQLLKGNGTFQSVRASIAWSNVPTIVSCLIWIITLVMFGAALFTSVDSPNNQLVQNSSYLILAFAFVRVVMSVWTFVICISALAEVQGFSILRAIGNIILATILFAIIAAILSFLLILFIGTQPQQAAALFFNH